MILYFNHRNIFKTFELQTKKQGTFNIVVPFVLQFKWLEMISAILEAEDLSSKTELVVHSVQYIKYFDKIYELYGNILSKNKLF